MKLAKYWAQSTDTAKRYDGESLRLQSWEGSDVSQAEAAEKADNKLRLWKQKLSDKQALNQYDYPSDRLIREQIIEEYHDPEISGEPQDRYAAITRNRYGALVLNASDVFFADVDLPESVARKTGFFQSLFSRPKSPDKQAVEEKIREHIRLYAEQHPQLHIRLYRTAAGFRVAILNQAFDPASSESRTVLQALNSDPLYMKLCETQGCYRSRLTPKPWRIDLFKRHAFNPDVGNGLSAAQKKWLTDYEAASRSFAVCRLVERYGPDEALPHAKTVIAMHDQYTLLDSDARLA